MAGDELLMETEPAPPAPPRAVSPWAAVAIIAVTLLIWFGYQTWNLQREYRGALAARAGQEGPIQQAQQRRAQLQSITRRLAALSQQGHAGASLLIQELARRGYHVSPDGPTPAPPPR
jgi:cell division protein FtsB